MSEDIREYTNGEMTIVWKPKTCIHSTICWKGLLDVFNPRERPWIKMNAASTERIIEQVRKCPSGALSYYLNNEPGKNVESDKIKSEAAHIMKIQVSANGPYLIQTECLIIHSDGKEEIKQGTIALCRCGASANKPYCDGSHKGTGFTG